MIPRWTPARSAPCLTALVLSALFGPACLSRATPASPPTPTADSRSATGAPNPPPSVPSRSGSELSTWLLLTDIHFNPFENPALVDALAGAPVEQWAAIFEADVGRQPSPYGSDTNYPLLRSLIAAMREKAPAPGVVLIGGDFLGHGFEKLYQATSKDRSEAAYDAFVDKTVAFLALELDHAFPDAQFVPAVGNNDSYCGDYAPAVGSPFLAHMAATWEPLVNRRHAAPDFVSSFSTGGYYSVRLSGSAVRVAVTNSVFWSVKYSERCGLAGTHPGQDELAWLTALLSSDNPPPTWILTHIPPGMDARSSAAKNKAATFYQPDALASLLSLIDAPEKNVQLVIAGHTHGDSFRLTQPDARGGNVPMWLLPSVSPIFKNNPAFIVAMFSPASSRVVDYTAYDLDDAPDVSHAWRTEYQFSSAYGADGVTPAALSRLRSALAADPALREKFEAAYVAGSPVGAIDDSTWHAYWCALGTMTAAQIDACLAAKP